MCWVRIFCRYNDGKYNDETLGSGCNDKSHGLKASQGLAGSDAGGVGGSAADAKVGEVVVGITGEPAESETAIKTS